MNKINSLYDLHWAYAVSKTLKFKLNPVGETQKFIDENKMVLLWKQRNTDYLDIKVFLDEMHSNVINEALSNITLVWLEEFEQKFLELQDLPKKERKKHEASIQKVKNNLKSQISNKITEYCNNLWKELSSKWLKITSEWKWTLLLFGKDIINVLSFYFPDNKSLFNNFNKFLWLLDEYNKSRKYIYSEWLAKRIIDENLLFFIQNKKIYDNFYKNSSVNFSSVEKDLDFSMNEIFNINYFNSIVNQKWITLFNSYIWWITKENLVKIKWINEIINEEKQRLYNQYLKDLMEDVDNDFKKDNFPMFKFLFKQILSEKEEQKQPILNDSELVDKLKDFINRADDKINSSYKLLEKLLDNQEVNYDKDWVYISKKSLNTLIPKYFKNGNAVLTLFKKYPDFISLFSFKRELNEYNNDEWIFKEKYSTLVNSNNYNSFCNIFINEIYSTIKKIDEAKQDILPIENLIQSTREYKATKVMKYLEYILNFYQQTQYFALEKSKKLIREWVEYVIDNSFYNDFDSYYNDFDIVEVFNNTRNYVVKKPFSQNKFQLHFENPQILAWWDINKESENGSYLFKKDWKYYLWIKNKWWKLKMENYISDKDEDFYEKFNSKFIWDPVKSLPKICFAECNKDLFNPSEKILTIKKNETFKTWEKFNKNDLIEIIDFYKECVKKYDSFRKFEFNFSDTKSYNSISDFYDEVANSWYEMWTTNVKKSYIDEKVSNGELYLFQVYTMDFSEYSNWNKKLNTLFLEGIFNNPDIFRINWNWSIFFRPKSIEKKENLYNKSQKYKRYTEDTILLHLTVWVNYNKNDGNINETINNYIAENKSKVRVLSLDRWEKNLITYTLLEWDNILEKWNFNIINNIDYLSKLKEISKERKKSQKNYLEIQKIKDLKNGYVGHLVGEVVKKAYENNAIIVLEDLNKAFKQSRVNIDFSIYQKFEDALIKKLNYLAFRRNKENDIASYSKWLQLTNPFWKSSGKQNWIIFYVNPVNTSTTCPKCWWKKDLYLKYKNGKTAIKDISNFDKIYFDKSKNNFVFIYNLKNFWLEKDLEISLNSNRDRIITYRDKEALDNFVSTNIDITKEFKKYLVESWIDYTTWWNLIQDITEKWMWKNSNQKNLFQNFYYVLSIVNQIRNSITGDDTDEWDYIACPCCSFDSRNIKWVLKNWDDVWAYNIWRKGLMLIDKVYHWYNDKKDKYPNLIITNDEFELYYRKEM